MDKLITVVLPTDIWNLSLDYLNTFAFYPNDNILPRFQYVVKTFAQNIDYIKNTQLLEPKYSKNMFEIMSRSSNIGVIKHLYDSKKLSKNGVIDSNVIENACKHGNLETLMYLTKNFKLTYTDATGNNNFAFRIASQNGQLNVLKYLYNTFKLTYEDATCDDNFALKVASENGHL